MPRLELLSTPQLPQSAGRAPTPTITAEGADPVAAGIAGILRPVSEAGFKIGQEMLAARRSIDTSAALDNAMRRMAEAKIELDRDADYKTKPERYIGKLREIWDASSKDLDNVSAAKFHESFRVLARTKYEGVLQDARKEEIDHGRAVLGETANTLIGIAADARSKVERKAALGEIEQHIETAKNAGILGEADALRFKKQTLGKFDELRVLRFMRTNPAAALGLLNNKTDLPNLDELTRERLRGDATAKMEANSRAASVELRLGAAEVLEAARNGDVHPGEAQILDAIKRAGPRYAQIAQRVGAAVAERSEVSAFKRETRDMQAKIVAGDPAALDAFYKTLGKTVPTIEGAEKGQERTGLESRIARRFRDAYEKGGEEFERDPLGYGVKNGILRPDAIKPLAFEDPARLAIDFKDREAASEAMKPYFGGATGPVLLPSEKKHFARIWDTVDADRKQAILAAAKASLTPQYYRTFLREALQGQPDLIAAGAARDPALGAAIIRGHELKKREGEKGVYLPPGRDLSDEINKQVGDLWRANPELRQMTAAAVESLYIGETAAQSDFQRVLKPTRVTEALGKLIAVAEFNGARIAMPAKDNDERDMRQIIVRISLDQRGFGNGVPVTRSGQPVTETDLLRYGKPHSLSPGVYRWTLRDDTPVVVKGEDGAFRPYETDMRYWMAGPKPWRAPPAKGGETK